MPPHSTLTRAATHAGSWYTSDGRALDKQLGGWLAEVDGGELPAPADVAREGEAEMMPTELPVRGARAVIAP